MYELRHLKSLAVAINNFKQILVSQTALKVPNKMHCDNIIVYAHPFTLTLAAMTCPTSPRV